MGSAAVLAGAGATPACRRVPAPLAETHAEAIRDSVRTALDGFRRFSAAARWDSLVTFYSEAPSFRFLENGTVRYRSPAQIRAALTRLPPGTRIESSYRDTEIDAVAPGVAVVHTLFETAFADSAGARFRFSGAVTLLWVHEAAGWRIRSGHSSAPLPRGTR